MPSASAGNISVDQKMLDRVGAQCWSLVTEHTPLPLDATVSIGGKPANYLTFLGQVYSLGGGQKLLRDLEGM